MKTVVSLFCVIFNVICLNIYAHENWIVPENYYPDKDTAIQLYICSGHDFPSSDVIISQKLLDNIYVSTPSGIDEVAEIVKDMEISCWKTTVKVNSTGTYIVSYFLKKPQMEEPLSWGKSIIVVERDSGDYITGCGLEIAPKQKLSLIRVGDKLPLVLLYYGERVKGNLSIGHETGKNIYMYTTKKKPAMIKIKKSGNYLITSRYNGKSCSFAFFVHGEDK